MIICHSGFAFVEYETMAEADEAIKDMHDKELFGGKIRVQLTKSRKPERSTRFQNERESYGPPRSRRPGPYDRYERYGIFSFLQHFQFNLVQSLQSMHFKTVDFQLLFLTCNP